MKIITDNGSDIPADIAKKLEITKIPLGISFNGNNYPNSSDINSSDFYKMLRENPDKFPTTSQPSVGNFVEAYETYVNKGEVIFSIHISSGLSGTFDTARTAANIVRQKYPDAKINLWDTKTLSVTEGWQVLTASHMNRAGKSLKEIEQTLEKLRQNTKFYFTLDTLKYLIHGGRISHLTGLIASMLNIRPIITVNSDGKYIDAGKFFSFKRAVSGMPSIIQHFFDPARPLCAQVVHGENPEGVALLTAGLTKQLNCAFFPLMQGDLALGAHVGESIVGTAVGYSDLLSEDIFNN